MSGLFGSIKVPGNRLTDLVGQTSTVGRPIPFGYGRVRVEEPNVIWTAGIPKEHVKKKRQGKGGVKTTEYTYTLSYAIAFMEGPIFGYLTIKRGSKTVFTTDPNAPIEDKQFAAKWLRKAKIYYGTEEQMPDATIESYVGAGKVSAFRGLAYIVVTDDDVTNEGGAVPPYEAIIIATPPDVYVTSRPYPQDMIPDQLATEGESLPAGSMKDLNPQLLEQLDTYADIPFAQLKNVQYSYGIPDERINASADVLSAALRSALSEYNMQPEGFNTNQAEMPAGFLKDILIEHTVRPADGFNTTQPSIVSAYLGP